MTENTLAPCHWDKPTCHSISVSATAGGTVNRCHKRDLQVIGHISLMKYKQPVLFSLKKKKHSGWFGPIQQFGKLVKKYSWIPNTSRLSFTFFDSIFSND